jgi:hypothetical protein
MREYNNCSPRSPQCLARSLPAVPAWRSLPQSILAFPMCPMDPKVKGGCHTLSWSILTSRVDRLHSAFGQARLTTATLQPQSVSTRRAGVQCQPR